MRCKGAFRGTMWYVLGDFNSDNSSFERVKGNDIHQMRWSSDYLGFKSFILQMELIDLPLLGRKFTWFQMNESN